MTNPKTTIIEGKTNGTALTARIINFPLNLNCERRYAPGNPMAIANKVLRRAWRVVKPVILQIYDDLRSVAKTASEKTLASFTNACRKTMKTGKIKRGTSRSIPKYARNEVNLNVPLL